MTRLLVALALLLAASGAGATPEKDAAMARIGDAVNEGRMAEAYRLSLPYAEAGDRDMQLTVASFLESGQDIGVALSQDARDALERQWLGRAALQLQPDAMKRLVQAFARGELGLVRSEVASTCWSDARASRVAPSACMAYLPATK